MRSDHSAIFIEILLYLEILSDYHCLLLYIFPSILMYFKTFSSKTLKKLIITQYFSYNFYTVGLYITQYWSDPQMKYLFNVF